MGKYDAFAESETPYRDADTMRGLYVDEGLTMNEIADKLDCGVATVSRWIDKHGIESRSRAEVNARAAASRPAHFRTNNRGREVWIDNTNGDYNIVQVHRLLAVAEYGIDAVVDNHIHHEENIPWLNTPDNIIPKDPSDHLRDHKYGNTLNEKITPSDCEAISARVTAGESEAEVAADYGVVERTIHRHASGNCHHD